MVNLLGRRDGGSEVDYTVNPQIGFPFMTGPTISPDPVNHVFPVWDFVSGQMIALGLLAAERHRRLTGQGQLVKIALKDVALARRLGNFGMIAEVMINDADRPKQGNYLYGAFGRDFETLDGKRVMVVGLTALQWSCLCKATGLTAEFNALGAHLGLDMSDEGDRFARSQGDSKYPGALVLRSNTGRSSSRLRGTACHLGSLSDSARNHQKRP